MNPRLIQVALIPIFIALLSACGEDQPKSPEVDSGKSAAPNEEERSTSNSLVLQVYRENDHPKMNEVSAVNMTKGDHVFDFIYKPAGDQTLSMGKFKTGPYLGCEYSDISIQFNLHHVKLDGEIDLSSSLGFGYSPTPVDRGETYALRLTLTLKKDCLGVVYNFGVIQALH